MCDILYVWHRCLELFLDSCEVPAEIDATLKLQSRLIVREQARCSVDGTVREADDAREGCTSRIRQQVVAYGPSRDAARTKDEGDVISRGAHDVDCIGLTRMK